MKKIFLSTFLFIGLSATAQSPDLIFHHGKIFTGDTTQQYVEAISIKGNLIFAVGSNDVIVKTAGKATQLIDLGGKTVIPGINDAHYHHVPTLKGQYIPYPEDGSEPSWQYLQQSIKNAVARSAQGEFIHGTFGIKTGTEEKIDRYVLDNLAPENPVILSAYWGHITILNSAAIKALGISETIQDPSGGSFERVPGKRLINGRVYEQAQFFLNRYELTNEILFTSSLKELGDQALYFGITSIQNMCTGATPEEYIRLLSKINFPVRMRLIRWGQLDANRDLLIPAVNLPQKNSALPLVNLSGTKWMMDGTPLEWSAAVLRGYKDKPGNYGNMNYEMTDFINMLKESESRNDQPIFHVVGDKTLLNILDVLDKQGAPTCET
jgi:predicted amidohydrolase YtcJ